MDAETMYIESTGLRHDEAAALGNRFLIGNGYLGVRGTLEEYGKDELTAVNLAGIYDRRGEGWREPLNAPNPWRAVPRFAGQAWRLPQHQPQAHVQRLDYSAALQERITTWYTPRGAFTVQSLRFAAMHHVHLLGMAYTLRAEAGGPTQVAFSLDGDVWDIHGPHYERLDFFPAPYGVDVLTTATQGAQVAVALRLAEDTPCRVEVSPLSGTVSADVRLEPGQPLTLHTLAAIYTSQDGPDPLALARQAVRDAQHAGFDALLAAHRDAWRALWQAARVEIEGDPDAEQALNYSIYHLLAIAPRHGRALSVAARGLSGQTYKGAVFWDTEMFMLDFYLRALPDVARAVVDYRIQTLPGALEKARQYGFAGAFYAWESQEGGLDACSDYNVTDVFTGRPVRTYFRDKQIHISAAVVYALMRVWRESDDLSLLTGGG
ncbi:MAG: glycoside hydrolase family 65 protein, partial [Oscillospiraceae bacterium]|nr:glycoside hydrolase family 65 protein [Oscillospiraceae bacterium]